jgi:hypothetical protein
MVIFPLNMVIFRYNLVLFLRPSVKGWLKTTASGRAGTAGTAGTAAKGSVLGMAMAIWLENW